ncbi:MAG: glutaredoxin family protein [Candidatus Moraniibacteriota bacterium]|jgi:glutaredoxin
MKEYKMFIWVGIFMVFAVGGLVWLAGQSEDIVAEDKIELNMDGITLFYGDGCPHCEDVDKFNEENAIKNKVVFDELEVWKNKENADLLEEAATICEFDLDTIGVPFLFSDNECYIGGPDVQEFFKKEAGL